MPVVDLHQHLLPARFIELLRQRTAPPYIEGTVIVTSEGRFPFDAAEHDLERRIELIDRLEIGVAIISLQPTLGQDALPAGERSELAAAWEEGVTGLVGAADGRLAALAAGPMHSGFVGSCVGTDAFTHDSLDELEPVMASLAGRRGFLFVHPSGGPTRASAPSWWGALALYTAQMQDAYLRWLSEGQPRWPDVRVVFAILAGGGPFQIERLASRGVGVRSALHDTIYFDTASYGRRALELCIETFGVEQLVYGSDLPVIDPDPTRLAVRGFGASVERLITHDTPTMLLS